MIFWWVVEEKHDALWNFYIFETIILKPYVLWGLVMLSCYYSYPTYMSIFTARKRSLRRLCFYTCLSFILFTGGVGIPACNGPTPPPEWRTTTPPNPPQMETPRMEKQPPPQMENPPPDGEPPTPPDGEPPNGEPPQMEKPPRWRTIPPPMENHPLPMVTVRAVRILLECILVIKCLLDNIDYFWADQKTRRNIDRMLHCKYTNSCDQWKPSNCKMRK